MRGLGRTGRSDREKEQRLFVRKLMPGRVSGRGWDPRGRWRGRSAALTGPRCLPRVCSRSGGSGRGARWAPGRVSGSRGNRRRPAGLGPAPAGGTSASGGRNLGGETRGDSASRRTVLVSGLHRVVCCCCSSPRAGAAARRGSLRVGQRGSMTR